MSYDIVFKVKVEGQDIYVEVGDCTANITWNLRDMIVQSTGLEWKNEANNGLCKDVIPYIEKGWRELVFHPQKYKKYEGTNGVGTVDGCVRFFRNILDAWHDFCESYYTRKLVDVTYFWIE